MPDLQAIAAEQGTKIIRLRLALMMLRAWSGRPNYDAGVVVTVNDWIDAGMEGPVPWPGGAFFEAWAAENSLSNIDGFVGYRATVRLQQ